MQSFEKSGILITGSLYFPEFVPMIKKYKQRGANGKLPKIDVGENCISNVY